MVFKFLSYDEKGFLTKITSYEMPRGKWVPEDIANQFQERLESLYRDYGFDVII